MLSPRLRSFEAGSVSPLLFHSSPSPPLVYQLSLFPLENPCKQTPFQHQSLSIRFFFPSSRFYRDRIVDTFWTRRETNPDTFPFFLSFPLLTLILIFRKRSCLWFFDSLSRFDAWSIFRTVERNETLLERRTRSHTEPGRVSRRVCVGSTLRPHLPHPSFPHGTRRGGLGYARLVAVSQGHGITDRIGWSRSKERSRTQCRLLARSLAHAPLIKPRRNDDPRKCASVFGRIDRSDCHGGASTGEHDRVNFSPFPSSFTRSFLPLILS